jgi:hypothetical protein
MNKHSYYIGVTVQPSNPQRPWKAQLVVAGKNYGLGYFEAQEDAALAYDNAAHYVNASRKKPRPFVLNFPQDYQVETPPSPTAATLKVLRDVQVRVPGYRDLNFERRKIAAMLKAVVVLGERAALMLQEISIPLMPEGDAGIPDPTVNGSAQSPIAFQGCTGSDLDPTVQQL